MNCAGIGLGERTIDREGNAADLGRFTWVLSINLIGTYNVAAQAAAAMSRTQPSHMTNVASSSTPLLLLRSMARLDRRRIRPQKAASWA